MNKSTKASFSGLVCTIVAILSIGLSCGEDDEPASGEISNVEIVNVTIDTCSDIGPSLVTLTIHFVDSMEGRNQYWVKVWDPYWVGQISYRGETEYRSYHIPGPDSLHFKIPYYSNLPASYHHVELFRAPSADLIGNEYAAESHALASNDVDIPRFLDWRSYYTDCCTKAKYRYYAQVQKNVPYCEAAATSILTRTGNLCCEGCSSPGDHSAVSVAVGNQTAFTSKIFAEMGYVNYRSPSGNIRYGAFLGLQNSTDSFVAYIADVPGYMPNENTEHSYRLELDVSSGEWSGFYDNRYIDCQPPPLWTPNVPGDYVSWAGEVTSYETDMAGIESAPCYMKECRYHDGLGWKWIDHDSDQTLWVNSDDDSQWMIEKVFSDLDAFKLWDVVPQSTLQVTSTAADSTNALSDGRQK
jgi:hypothetical protein